MKTVAVIGASNDRTKLDQLFLSPKKEYARWITEAEREKTIRRRLWQLILMLRNKRPAKD